MTAGASVALTGNTITPEPGPRRRRTDARRGHQQRQSLARRGRPPRSAPPRRPPISATTSSTTPTASINVELDGTTAEHGGRRSMAENNWWGLRSTAVTPPNAGPAISPTTNPAFPENPVNGAGIPDGTGTTSNTVDFFPYRNGSQADPDSGQFADPRRAAARRRRRPDRVAGLRPRPRVPRRDDHADRHSRRRLRRQARLVLLGRRADRHGPGGAVQVGVHDPRGRHLRRRRGRSRRSSRTRRGRPLRRPSTSASSATTARSPAQVNATLALTLGAPASFGASHPGRCRHVHREHDAPTCISTARRRDAERWSIPARWPPAASSTAASRFRRRCARAATNATNPSTQFARDLGHPADAADLRRTDLQ